MNGEASASRTLDAKAVFKQIYYDLKKELLQDPAFDFTDESREWIDKVRLPFFPCSIAIVTDCISPVRIVLDQLLQRAYDLVISLVLMVR